MQSVTNPFQACQNIILKPNGVFAQIRTTDNWSWIPFFLIVGFAILPSLFYFSQVDINWYRDVIVQSAAGSVSPAEQNMMRQTLNKELLLLSGAIGAVLYPILGNVILALYLHFCAKADEECIQGFTDWYGFCWWVSLPMIPVSILSIIGIFLSDTSQIAPSLINITSLAYLFSLDMNSAWYGLCQSIHLEHFWFMYLTAVGLAQWTSLTKQRIKLIAIAPYGIIWAIWLFAVIF